MREILDRKDVPEEYEDYFQILIDLEDWEGVDQFIAESLLDTFPKEPMVELTKVRENYTFEVKSKFKDKFRTMMREK